MNEDKKPAAPTSQHIVIALLKWFFRLNKTSLQSWCIHSVYDCCVYKYISNYRSAKNSHQNTSRGIHTIANVCGKPKTLFTVLINFSIATHRANDFDPTNHRICAVMHLCDMGIGKQSINKHLRIIIAQRDREATYFR